MSGVEETAGSTPRERGPGDSCGAGCLVALVGVFAAGAFFRWFAVAVVVASVALGVWAGWVTLVARYRGRGGAAAGRLTWGEVVAVALAVISAVNSAALGVWAWRALYAAPAVRVSVPHVPGGGLFLYAAGVLFLIGAVLAAERQPRATMRASALALALTGALGVIVAMAMPLEARELSAARGGQCTRNVMNLARALQMYATDYDRYPPAEKWSEALSDYVEGSDAYQCPEAVSAFAYAYNATLDRVQPEAIPAPDRAISILESDAGRDAHGGKDLLPSTPRHYGGDNFGFVDGHVKWVSRQAALDSPRQYLWEATKAPEQLPGRGPGSREHNGAGEEAR